MALTELHRAQPQRCSSGSAELGRSRCCCWGCAVGLHLLKEKKPPLFVHVPAADAEGETARSEPGLGLALIPLGALWHHLFPKPPMSGGRVVDVQPQASAEPPTAISGILHLIACWLCLVKLLSPTPDMKRLGEIFTLKQLPVRLKKKQV